jgi:acyl transferase domain-containing protein
MSRTSGSVHDLGSLTAVADFAGGVAVIGAACRLPGAADPHAFWELLDGGRSALGSPPQGRFPEGHEPVPPGGYLPDVDRFDPEFFGIAPAEAAYVDPQQRLVLELAWEGLEDAGVLPRTLAGSRAGVFVGAMSSDYSTLVHQHGPDALTRHTLTGLSRGLIANRVSHLLDLHGPSLSIDSAQSSSLVAVHLALESLRSGESDLALVAGVNLNLASDTATVLQRFGGLSPDGRCFTFDAAPRFRLGRGRLCWSSPLQRAWADDDAVYAVLLGSAINSDGTGSGLTAPNTTAQADLIRSALSQSGVSADEVQYVELHGTGTPVGDPVEAQALGAVLGGRPTDRRLEVGSVKTNIGHLAGAAGLVGLLKTVLAVRHRRLPASLNFEQANPAIDLAGLGVQVRTESGPWPRPGQPLLAGVSSFGVGGSNAHVVVAEAPPSGPVESPTGIPAPVESPAENPAPARQSGPLLWALSARTAAGVTMQARRLHEHLARHPGLDPAHVAHALATHRTAFEHRAVLLGSDRAELMDALTTLERGEQSPEVIRGRIVTPAASTGRTATVFVFPGQGTQWPEMARQLLAESPVFAGQLGACAEALAPLTDWSLRDVLLGAQGAPTLERVDVVQPVLFSVMVSLAALWRALGIHPDAVIGHSQGEIAAAYVAGALDLDDAARVVALRSQAIRELLVPGTGGMASVPLPADAVLARVSGYGGGIEVAAVNGPGTTVVSGARDLVEELVVAYQAEGVQARGIPVDYASHSTQVEPLADELAHRLRGLRPRTGSVAFYSSVTGGRFDPAGLTPEYWHRNLRSTVEFERAVRAAVGDGHQAFVEVSPHPVLTVGLAQVLEEHAAVTSTLRRGEGGLRRVRTCVAELHTRSNAVDLARLAGPDGAAAAAGRVPLPTYAFRRRRFWFDGEESWSDPEPGDGTGDVLEVVRAGAAVVLGYREPAEVDPDSTFKDLGFDSVSAVELRDRLSAITGQPLPVTLTQDRPTPRAVARYLATLASPPKTPERPSGRAVRARRGVRTGHVDRSVDPIAIVSMSGRWPGGAADPDQLWELVRTGRDATGVFPDNRGWDLDGLYDPDGVRPGSSSTRRGGFLDEADLFDAEFFGIGPREAIAMEPQQRLLLECAWELLERATIVPATLRGSRTAVFVGLTGVQEYGARLHESPPEAAGHALTGALISVASGRLAYVLGLEGPALTVDTACSSSLVTIHLAAQALRTGETDLALVGGVSVMPTPGLFTEFTRQQGLAPDGRCKPFAAAADGTAWAEAVGMVLLERLSDARRNGHPVLALVRGSAVNSDGASNGLSAPNGPSQERVIRAALAAADLSTADVDVVEAHGTGTVLGDPIEAQALIATYGRAARQHPLLIGSIKSNLGHTLGAAGVTGVIKMVQAFRHGELPGILHLDQPSPHVDWSAGAVELLTTTTSWPDAGRPRRAAVSSFGISGTNAHLILEEAPAQPPTRSTTGAAARMPSDISGDGPQPWVLSARNGEALQAQAQRLLDHLDAVTGNDSPDTVTGNDSPDTVTGNDTSAVDRRVAQALAGTRTRFRHKAVVIGADRAARVEGLRALAVGMEAGTKPAPAATVLIGGGDRVRGARVRPSTAFLFPGQGSQRPGAGRELHRHFPRFAAALDETTELFDAEFDRHAPLPGSVPRPLREVMFAEPTDPGAALLDLTAYTQPALFALQVALARLVGTLGVHPDRLLGHSIG